MIEALAKTIARSQIYPISVGIFVEDFNAFTEPQRMFMTGGTLTPDGKFKTTGSPNKPYFVPFQNALKKVTDYVRPGRKANFFFGLDRPMAKYATAFFKEIKTRDSWLKDGWTSRSRLGDPAFPLAKETPQLQAADLLAYLTWNHLTEVEKTGNIKLPVDPLLKMCLAKMRSRYDHGYQTREVLQAVLDKTYELSGNWDGR